MSQTGIHYCLLLNSTFIESKRGKGKRDRICVQTNAQFFFKEEGYCNNIYVSEHRYERITSEF